MKVGDVLKSKGKPTIRIVGRAPDGLRWLAERADKFGPAFPVEHVELVDYGVRDTAFPDDEAAILGRRDQEATDAANGAYGRGSRETRRNGLPETGELVPPAGSPEDVFASLVNVHED
jgi:hypothetical protein